MLLQIHACRHFQSVTWTVWKGQAFSRSQEWESKQYVTLSSTPIFPKHFPVLPGLDLLSKELADEEEHPSSLFLYLWSAHSSCCLEWAVITVVRAANRETRIQVQDVLSELWITLSHLDKGVAAPALGSQFTSHADWQYILLPRVQIFFRQRGKGNLDHNFWKPAGFKTR